mmetsp:Transcript_22195/g.29692  ORF Transcript_22195/g.29692 Transcript_22195/m.29692 type:complete len:231 (-) Transcript_22195:238-930(-)|eukprot:CAMPEP_0185579470 /NCGR_PEP_ID=MMETSP0434-20130131/14896_1 /TAXON_ID=626734 ORGANISM="Favella taraikaensis, Strain Fe Narragansett Bay" /NCGR_SAMPLE_ID=MMETSP0434 /ASSEMBLY_ACC=CAM_ASM_000379 /LENGTH=230 /DNA_ID=CAMNT_0028197497 /DNA_START=16 /DNA_END=708 /DNA_ORIENTATION=+
MMNMFARRALAARPTAMRSFSSSLLVPLAARAEVPAEIESQHISEAAHALLQEKYAAFNEQCKAELQEMNKNIIEAIVSRGGTEGWDTDVNALTRSFEFDSFEEAQAFVMRVAKDADVKDHHPEWRTADGGRTVTARLTSHFAQNTVTRLDFELAEAMNNAYAEVRGSFKLYPLLDAKQWASLKIGVGLLVSTIFFYKFVTGSGYEEKEHTAAPLPSTSHESPVAKYSKV